VLTLSQRRGFSLLETVIATSLMLIVSGAAYRLLITTQRLVRAQAEHMSLQSSVRSGALLVANELRELSTVPGGEGAQNDLLSLGAAGVTFRAARGVGFLCQTPSTSQIRLGRADFSGHRDPQALRDSAHVFLEGSPDTDLDDTWLPLAIADVSATARCPSGGEPGITLAVSNGAALVDAPPGTPVRISEIMEVRLYRSEGKSWLGARSISAEEAIQPLLGPLRNDDGFRLEYLSAAGDPTWDPDVVESIRITLRAAGEGATPREEELVTRVALRNAFRP
jgi:prepilin-type N-terminal cleavage/methylation domain-containing protein